MTDSQQAPNVIYAPEKVSGGEMGERIRAKDWSKTPLGPIERWSQSLKTAIQIMLNSPHPTFICWGSDFINFYNDHYIPILGKRHPKALGISATAEEVWADIWETIGPKAKIVLSENRATRDEEHLLITERNGHPEETYYTFSYSPLLDDEGAVVGVFGTCIEETEKILGRRRLQTLRHLLSEQSAQIKSVKEACDITIKSLESNPHDLPFALIYLLDADCKRANLAGATKWIIDSHADHPPPAEILIDEADSLWPFHKVIESGTSQVVTDLEKTFGALSYKAWPASAQQAIVLPLVKNGKDEITGFLVTGVSPRLTLDDDYSGFLSLMSGQIAKVISTADAYEKENRHIEAFARLERELRAEAEHKAREAEETQSILKTFLDHVPEGITIAGGPPKFPIIANSKQAQEWLGRPGESTIGVSAGYHVTAYGVYLSDGITHPTIEQTPLYRATRYGERVTDEEWIIERPDGSRITVLVNVTPIRDNGERIIGAISCWRDITEYRRAEEALRQSQTEQANAIRTLRENQEILTLAMRSSRMGAWSRDIATNKVWWSEELEEIFGLEIGHFAGTLSGYYDLVYKEDVERIRAEVACAVSERRDYIIEFRFHHADGSLRWMEGRGRAVYAEEGGPLKVYGIGIDITERKRVEEALRESEERYRAFVEQSSEAIWRFELEQPLFTKGSTQDQIEHFYKYAFLAECNDVMARMYGYSSAKQIIGARLNDFLSPSDESNIDYLSQFIASGYRLTEGESHELDVDGNPKYFLNNLIGIIENDFLLRAWGTQRDITERKLAEERLRRSEEQLSLVINTAPVYITHCDTQSRYVFANKAYAERFGLKPEDLIGKHIAEVLGDESYENIRPYIETVLSGKAVNFEIEIPYQAIGNHYMSCSYVPELNESGRPLGFVAVITDITERRKDEVEREKLLQSERGARESAETANRLKDEFLATVSHELRTPLNSILGWSVIAKSTFEDTEKLLKALEIIERSARSQNQIISDILDVSRIITGKLKLDSFSIELITIIEEALENIRPAIEAKRIQLRTSYDTRAQAVIGDPNRLQQVFWNLLTNAVKFTPENGNIEVKLKLNGNRADVIISDDGEGIDEEFLPFVFDRFRQADSSISRRHGGLGLGLAIVRHLIEMHGGNVSVESKGKGKGATFKVSLPLTVMQFSKDDRRLLNQKRVDETTTNVRDEVLQNTRILVVDDEPDAAELVRLFLDRHGAKVSVRQSAKDALSELDQTSFDLIISDIGMPNEDGYNLIRKIRARPKELGGHTPAIALTAYARKEDAQRSIAEGYQVHISKPVDVNRLVEIVLKLAGKQ